MLWNNSILIYGVFRWLTVVWLLGIGSLLRSGRQLVRLYVFSEIILLLPSVIFFAFVIWSNPGPDQGYPIADLLYPVLVTLAFSVIPLVIAFWSRRSSGHFDSLKPLGKLRCGSALARGQRGVKTFTESGAAADVRGG